MAVLSSTANSIANKCINTVISQEHNKLLLLLLLLLLLYIPPVLKSVFMLPVGLCEWRIHVPVHQDCVRTFEAEILKILKNILPQPKN